MATELTDRSLMASFSPTLGPNGVWGQTAHIDPEGESEVIGPVEKPIHFKAVNVSVKYVQYFRSAQLVTSEP